jgi:hypothetical protein
MDQVSTEESEFVWKIPVSVPAVKANRHQGAALRRRADARRSGPAPFVLLRALVLQPMKEAGHKPPRGFAESPGRSAAGTVTRARPGNDAS